MARKRKQKNKVARFFLVLLLVVAIIAVGYLYKTYFYEEPESLNQEQQLVGDTHHHDVAGGDIDVDVIKSEELSIHFLELGNKYTGDCTLIKVGNTEVLIDAGSKADSVPTIANYLNTYVEDGVIEYVIVTHAHQDHYAGFATGASTDSLFDLFCCKTIIKFARTNQSETATLYKNFNRELEETKTNNGSVVYTALECYNQVGEAKREYDLGNSVSLEILYQKFYEQNSSSENNYSVCCLLTQNNEKNYLFTGDLESDGESSLVDNNTLPEVELYKAGHHGSKTSSSTKLMNVIKPKIVCVCCCAGSSEYTSVNENMFPTQAFVDRVAPFTKNVFVTTLCVDYSNNVYESFNGNIVVYCSIGKDVKVSCSNNRTPLYKTDWFKQNRVCPESWIE